MNPDLIFSICNTAVLVPWLLLIVAPNWKFSQLLIYKLFFPIFLSLAYLVLIVQGVGNMDLASFSTLDGVFSLFNNKTAVLIGWLHYLAFDLVVGSWLAKDAQQAGISQWLVAPCLFFTLMFGPVGFLLYCCLKFGLKKQLPKFYH